MKQYIVDAFTDKIFSGNPAAVCVLDNFPSEEIMQSIAAENNLSETAFVVKENDRYHIRWFTPGREIDFCGHATLATAFVLFNFYAQDADTLNLYGQIGEFTVHKSDDLIRMEFPAYKLEHIEITDMMIEALGTIPLRPREKKIWEATKKWLNEDKNNKLLFVIDEAHMYRGSSGGEVALLIRRMFHKLGIERDRVQFILTTASMQYGTDDEKKAVMTFARELTSSSIDAKFVFLRGEREVIEGMQKYDIPIAKFKNVSISDIEENDNARLEALNSFWDGIEGAPKTFDSLDEACVWMYDNIIHYRPFFELIRLCRGNAVSLGELAKEIFPNTDEDDALNAVSVLLAIAPLARKNNMVLFPARMHMLFRGIKGVYACANKLCTHSHSHKSLILMWQRNGILLKMEL